MPSYVNVVLISEREFKLQNYFFSKEERKYFFEMKFFVFFIISWKIYLDKKKFSTFSLVGGTAKQLRS